jgi:hypothetical protein
MGLAVISMAMSAKKMVVDIAAGAAAMFGQSGWAGFAGVAAMMAVMAGLGVAMTGGSKSSGVIQESTKTTGTVLGDSNKQSESISNITKTLNDISDKHYPELKNITSAVKDLGTAQSSMLINMFRGGGVKLGTAQSGQLNDNSMKMLATTAVLTGGLGVISSFVLSKIPIIGDILGGIGKFFSNGLFGKVTQSVVGGGVRLNDQSMGSVMDSGAIDGNTATTIDTKKSSWFKTTHKISEVLTALDDSISSGMGKIFTSMGKATLAYWDYLGLDLTQGIAKLSAYNIPAAFIKTFGLKDDEIQKAFENYNSMSFDKMIEYMFGGFAKQFQQLGETLTETMNRVTVNASQVRNAFKYLGADMTKTDEKLVVFSDRMIIAFDGLKNLVSTIDAIVNKYVSKETKSAIDLASVKKFLTPENRETLAGAGITKETLVPIDDLISKIEAGTTVSAAEMKSVGEKIASVAQSTYDASKAISDSADKYTNTTVLAFKEHAFVHENPKITDAMITLFSKWGVSKSDTLAEAEKKVGSSSGKWDAPFKPAIKHFIENESTKAEGIAGLQGLGIDAKTMKEFNVAAAEFETPVTKALEVISGLDNAIVNLSSSYDGLNTVSAKQVAIQEDAMKKITSATATTQRARDIEINGLEKTKATGLDPLFIAAHEKWAKTLTDEQKALYGISAAGDITVRSMQALSYSLDDTAKSFGKLSDSSKYLMDFSRSIDTWVKNLRATSLGTPESQLKASQANFGEQIKLAQFGATAEIKRTALSGITGYADTYINALKNYYASSEEGVNAIEQVIKEVSGLEKGLSIQELQLNELQRIKDAIDDGTIAGDKNYQSLINATKQAGIDAKLNPTAENQLKYDAFASVILSIDKSKQEGKDAAFIDKLISGGQSLEVQTKILIESADFSLSQKESVINGVLADFNKQIGFNVSESFKSETDRVNASWKEVKLPTTETDNAKTSVTGLTGGLKDLNGQYDVVITKTVDTGAKIVDFSNTANNTKFGLNTESVAGTVASFEQITKSANDAKYAMESLAMADAAKRETTTKGNAFLESKATNAGYQGDLTDIDAMNAFLSPKPVITKQSKIATVDELKILGALSSKYNAMSETAAKASGLTKFANGGIANTASIFGEAGAEAAVPLPDGRTIPVTLSRDSANDSGETVAELREISRKQEIMINTLIAAAQESRKQNQVLVTEIEGLRTDTRLRRAA